MTPTASGVQTHIDAHPLPRRLAIDAEKIVQVPPHSTIPVGRRIEFDKPWPTPKSRLGISPIQAAAREFKVLTGIEPLVPNELRWAEPPATIVALGGVPRMHVGQAPGEFRTSPYLYLEATDGFEHRYPRGHQRGYLSRRHSNRVSTLEDAEPLVEQTAVGLRADVAGAVHGDHADSPVGHFHLHPVAVCCRVGGVQRRMMPLL